MMPYASNTDMPPAAKKGLSDKERSQWRAIFNSCHMKSPNDEAKCFRMANGVVKGRKERDDAALVLEEREVVASDGTKSYQYVDSYEYQDRAYNQDEVNYNPVGGNGDTACSNCRFFISPARCSVVSGDIAPNGVSDMWDAIPSMAPMEPMPVTVMGFGEKTSPTSIPAAETVAKAAETEKSLIERISTKVVESLKSMLTSAPPEPPSVLTPFALTKSADGRYRFMAIMTNNFKDVHGETFTEASHKEYVDWAEKSGTYPELWLWHTPGSRFGQVDWLDHSNGFVVASGWVDGGKEAIAEKLAQQEEIGVSHGFVCLKTKDGTIVKYRSYEMSPLPIASAANEWTSFGIKENEMPFSEKRREWLTNLVGEDTVKSWEQNTEALGTKLKELGVEYKSKMESDGEGAEAGSKDLAVEVQTLTKALADTVLVVADIRKSAEAIQTELETVKAEAKKSRDDIVTEELKSRASQLPQGFRASESGKTVSEGAKEKDTSWFETIVMGAEKADAGAAGAAAQ